MATKAPVKTPAAPVKKANLDKAKMERVKADLEKIQKGLSKKSFEPLVPLYRAAQQSMLSFYYALGVTINDLNAQFLREGEKGDSRPTKIIAEAFDLPEDTMRKARGLAEFTDNAKLQYYLDNGISWTKALMFASLNDKDKERCALEKRAIDKRMTDQEIMAEVYRIRGKTGHSGRPMSVPASVRTALVRMQSFSRKFDTFLNDVMPKFKYDDISSDDLDSGIVQELTDARNTLESLEEHLAAERTRIDNQLSVLAQQQLDNAEAEAATSVAVPPPALKTSPKFHSFNSTPVKS